MWYEECSTRRSTGNKVVTSAGFCSDPSAQSGASAALEAEAELISLIQAAHVVLSPLQKSQGSGHHAGSSLVISEHNIAS